MREGMLACSFMGSLAVQCEGKDIFRRW